MLDRVLKLETNERTLNLVLDGVKERSNETDENLYHAVVNVFNNIHSLKGKARDLEILNCFKIGPFNRDKPRSIVLTFGNMDELDLILHIVNYPLVFTSRKTIQVK